MEKNWKERAKSLIDNDFFVDFDEPTEEIFGAVELEEGFYRDEYDLTKDKISEEELYQALVTAGELVSLNAGDQDKVVSFKDGGRYSDTTYEITEYDGSFTVSEFHNSDDGAWKEGDYHFETDSFETLYAELQKMFPKAFIGSKLTEEVPVSKKAISEMSIDEKVELANKLFTSIAEKKLFGANFDYDQITGRNALTSAEIEDYAYNKNCFFANPILFAECDFSNVWGEADQDEDGWYTYYNFDDVEYDTVRLVDLDNGEVEVDGYYVTLQDTDNFEKEDYEITDFEDEWCSGIAFGGVTCAFSIEAVDNIE